MLIICQCVNEGGEHYFVEHGKMPKETVSSRASFKHRQNEKDPNTTRNIRTGYCRHGNTFPTITKNVDKFCDDYNKVKQTPIGVESLSAHVSDVKTDTVILKSDSLVLEETWMQDDSNPPPTKNCECISKVNNRTKFKTNAGGEVALYHNISSPSSAKVVKVELTDTARFTKGTGDIRLVEITCFTRDSSFKFVLGAACFHPGSSPQDVGMLLYQALFPYVHNTGYVPPTLLSQVDPNVPILLCGDFNTNVNNDDGFLQFLRDMFNLQCVSGLGKSTTLQGTNIDLTFTRHITLETLPIISYLSYHRPILNQITQIGNN